MRTRYQGLAAALCAGVLLAACAPQDMPGRWGGNPLMYKNHLDDLRAATRGAPATNFNGALATEYLALGDSEAAQADWIDSDHFAVKGLSSARGSAVAPDDVGSRVIPPPKQGELQAARQRLLAALDAGGRDRLPAVAARAQSRYDCWLEQQEENWQIDDIASCRAQFLAAMNELEARPAAPVAAPAGAREYRVYFEFDRSNLTPEAQQIVQRAAQELQAGGSPRIELIGKADRSGTDQYNLRLSQRRAQTVQDALIRAGVPRDRITTRAVGEREPPVPTPDGVREPRNRVVEIMVR
jgi:OOP family OmpA-OmpF porin